MLESTELDYESMLKSYSVQDVALEQSCKQRAVFYNIYEETLQEYKEVKDDYLKSNEEHQTLHANFTGKLNIKNSFNQLHMIPNSKLNEIQREVLAIYEMMSTDSDNFVDAVDTSVEKFQSLGSEFDESAILKNKSECIKKTEVLTQIIKEHESKYYILTHCEKEYEYTRIAYNLKKQFLNNLLDYYEPHKIISGISENKQHLALLTKNIEFLKERNREFEDQCQAFSN
ncbi:uncharacterized protein LOC135122518 [Zophobas morio]|uniref:uncharacterized protein LOC135122518 n=1 Tax=Zophobas morio TaxID=2755281 RepID=UPI0030837EC0